MTIKKRILMIVASLFIISCIAITSVVAFHHFLPREDDNSRQQSETDALEEEAAKWLAAGTKNERTGQTNSALLAYEDAYELYKKLNNTEAMASLIAKIEYMQSILENTGQKVKLKVDITQRVNNESTPKTVTGDAVESIESSSSTPVSTNKTESSESPVQLPKS